METPKRYHPVLVTLHWLIVLLVSTDLFLGFLIFEPQIRTGGAFRISETLLAVHMAAGIAILILLAVRLFVRLRTRKPTGATSGNKLFDVLARVTHHGLYFFVFAITVVGLVFAVQTNRLQRAFFGSGLQFAGPGNGNFGAFPTPGPGTPRPSFGGGNGPGFGNAPGGTPGFQGNGPRPGGPGGRFGFTFFLLPLHLDIAILLLVLIGIHILAALYHQFIRRDNLIGRMWFGKA